jgi:hypothetical protein
MMIKNITKSSQKIDQSGINESPLASALFRHIKEYYPSCEENVGNAEEIQRLCEESTSSRA